MRQSKWKQILAWSLIFGIFHGSLAVADTQVGSLYISGNVPVVFNLNVRSIPGELDFGSGTVVTNRLLAILHLRVNIDILTFTITSSTANGEPLLGGVGGASAVGAWTTAIAAAPVCTLLTPGAFVIGAAAGPGIAIQDDTPANVAVEEDCYVTGSWTAPVNVPTAGAYYTTWTLTMISS